MPSISPPELCFLRLLAAHIALYQCTWFVHRASDDSERTDGQMYPRYSEGNARGSRGEARMGCGGAVEVVEYPRYSGGYSGGDYWRWAGGTAHSGDGLWNDS